MIKYGIIGAGWRTEFYIRIALLLPEKFNVSGIYIRNKEKQIEFSRKYNVKIADSLEKLIETCPDFIVSCVSKDNILSTVRELNEKSIPVLTETPVTEYNPELKAQVAEQFHFQPTNMAIKSIIDSGILGEVNHVQLSCCHEYHAASLIRFFLNITNEMPQITTINLTDKVTRYNSRAGEITPTLVDSPQTIKIFKFKEKTAIYDFSAEQYFSDIRSSRIIVRGTMGEIADNKCTYLYNGCIYSFTLNRNAKGAGENLDGFSLLSITGNGKLLYKNPFPYARLSDEEIAIATCLLKMDDYVKNGKEFYSLKSAAIDTSFFK